MVEILSIQNRLNTKNLLNVPIVNKAFRDVNIFNLIVLYKKSPQPKTWLYKFIFINVMKQLYKPNPSNFNPKPNN